MRVVTGRRFWCEIAKRTVIRFAGDEVAGGEMDQRRSQQRAPRKFCAAAVHRADALHERVKLAQAILRQQGIIGQNGKSSSSRVS
jgi:hypothetical protein